MKEILGWILTRWYFWALIFIQFIWASYKNSIGGQIYVSLLIPLIVGSFINWITLFLLGKGIVYLYKKYIKKK